MKEPECFLFPTDILSMALRKEQEKQFQPEEHYSEIDLLRFVQNQNVKAWVVMLVWLSLNAVFGVLYLFHLFDEADLLMLTVFFFLCDYICILIFSKHPERFWSGANKTIQCANCKDKTCQIKNKIARKK